MRFLNARYRTSSFQSSAVQKKFNMTTSSVTAQAAQEAYLNSDVQKKRDIFEQLAAKHNLCELWGLLLDDSDKLQIAISEPEADGSYRAIRLGIRDDITFELRPVDTELINMQGRDSPVYMSTSQNPVEGEDLLTPLQSILADKGVIFTMVNPTTCSFEFTAERTEFLFTCATLDFEDQCFPCIRLSFGRWDKIVDGIRYEKMRYV